VRLYTHEYSDANKAYPVTLNMCLLSVFFEKYTHASTYTRAHMHTHYLSPTPPYPLCVHLVEVLVEKFPNVKMHDWLRFIADLGGFRGIGIVEGTLDQGLLPPVQMEDRLLPHENLQESSSPEVGLRGAEQVTPTLLDAEACHVNVVVGEVPQEKLRTST